MNREQRFFINKLRTLLSKIDRSSDTLCMSKDMEYVILQTQEIIRSFDCDLGVKILTDVELEKNINYCLEIDSNCKKKLEEFLGPALYSRDCKYYYMDSDGVYPLTKALLRKTVTYLIDLVANIKE